MANASGKTHFGIAPDMRQSLSRACDLAEGVASAILLAERLLYGAHYAFQTCQGGSPVNAEG